MTGKELGGQPAQAQPMVMNENGVSTAWENHPSFGGLTKRQTFAMAAMQGLLANSEYTSSHDKEECSIDSLVNADALLDALAKEA